MKEDKRKRIFKEAAELFARDGYYKVSVREICEAAGVTKPVLYYYFRDKENLLYEMMVETRRIVEELVKKHLKSDVDFEEKLDGIVRFYVQFMKEYPYLMKFSTFVQFMSAPEKVKKYKYDAAERDWKKLEMIFRDAQKNGKLIKNVHPKILAQNFIGSVIVILSSYLMNHIDENKFKKDLNTFLEFWKSQFVLPNN